MDNTELSIAISSMRGEIPKDLPLKERIEFSMRYVRKHERDIFWMSGEVNEDAMMRTAICSVMVEGSDEDKDILTRSMKPLKALNALMSGIPVDMSQVEMSEDLIPLVGIWHETAAKSNAD